MRVPVRAEVVGRVNSLACMPTRSSAERPRSRDSAGSTWSMCRPGEMTDMPSGVIMNAVS